MSCINCSSNWPRFRYFALAYRVSWVGIFVQALFPLAMALTPVMTAQARQQPQLAFNVLPPPNRKNPRCPGRINLTSIGFVDYDLSRSHSRIGIGAEYWCDYLKLSALSALSAYGYIDITGWRNFLDVEDYEVRSNNGRELREPPSLPTYSSGLSFLTISTMVRKLAFGIRKIVRKLHSPASSRHAQVERHNNIVLKDRKKETIRIALPEAREPSHGVLPPLHDQKKNIQWEALGLTEAGDKMTGKGQIKQF